MSAHHSAAVFVLSLLLLPIFAAAHPCSEGFEVEAQNRNMTCRKKSLGVEFGWNYHNQTRRLHIIVGARLDSETGWLAWGVNPEKEPRMVGTRALIGIKQQNQTLLHHTYNITRSTKLGCQLLPSKIDLEVENFRFFPVAEIQYYVIEASIFVPTEYNISRINLVWQVGNVVAGLEPKMHLRNLANFDCKETIDLISGSIRGDGAHKLRNLRMAHGILNIVGWGTLLPIGAITARYFRRYPAPCKSWFAVHISFQIAGWIVGTVGWIIGLLLGNASKYYGFHIHRILGIFIFTFTTLQMLALRLKPSKNDEYRTHWNMYHHFLGYSLLAIITVNIFQGIAIVKKNHIWRWGYIGILVLLAFTALSLELFTWIKFCSKRCTRTTTTTTTGQEKAGKQSSPSQTNPAQGSLTPNISHKPNQITDSSAASTSSSKSKSSAVEMASQAINFIHNLAKQSRLRRNRSASTTK